MDIGWDLNRLPKLVTPSLVVNIDAVRRNIDRMVRIAGETDRLRPHVKTHKSPDAVSLHCDVGVSQFKAATLTEVRCAIGGGAKDVLLAHVPVGEKVDRLVDLCRQFPDVNVSTIADDAETLPRLNDAFVACGRSLGIWIDVDCGMGRTGISFNGVPRLSDAINRSSGLKFSGLHVYDGHLHQPSLDERTDAVEQIHGDLLQVAKELPLKRVVVGGSPTFAIWAKRTLAKPGGIDWQFSPGTTVYWDIGYADAYNELGFEVCAGVLATVISRPQTGDGRVRYCLDAGTKSIASEMPMQQRVRVSGARDATVVSQSEEHLVVEHAEADRWPVGHRVLLLPRHICPTVAKFHQAQVVDDAMNAVSEWAIAGRHGL